MQAIRPFFSTSVATIGLSVAMLAPTPTYAQSAINEISLDPDKQSVASLWVSEALFSVADPAGTYLGPTGASRAYGILGTAMYDAWSFYDPLAISSLEYEGLLDFAPPLSSSSILLQDKQEAVSYAAFGVLNNLFVDAGLQSNFRQQMLDLGFDPDNDSIDLATPAGVGNFVANMLLEYRHQDGSNQLGDDPRGTLNQSYSDTSGYLSTNTADNILDIVAWTPESVPIDFSPSDPSFIRTQGALTPHWGNVTPFALESGAQLRPAAPKRFLLDENATVNLADKTITRADGTVVPITKALIGTDINPGFIKQTERVIWASAELTDEQKLIAEFWEDPSGSPFPPGTWMLFGQKVAEKENPELDKDIPLFLALGNAAMDAGIATWEAKYFYDYTRPVRAVRELGKLGLIGEDSNSDGLFEIEAWAGPGLGTQTIDAVDFLTFQTPGGDPSPPFPEYGSGHSAFSSASAEVLKLYTGSDDFLLGDGTLGLGITVGPGNSRFESSVVPLETTTLFWETFTEAADEAGISRIYGGIHFDDGDLNSRILGRQVGQQVFAKSQLLLSGGGSKKSVPEPGTIMGLFMFSGLMFQAKRLVQKES